ncbi:MAG TPA: carbonic anhydrase [Candidatus Dormibacteraeota bacterium]|jgi:carbonic anhydrase|nr:carbonic anhydrase [Candidatus Dormibacteraeota bacterium]
MKRFLLALLFLLSAMPLGAAQEHAAAIQPTRPPDAVAGAAVGEKIWADLMDGNQRFISGQTKPRELVQLRHTLAKGQHPRVIVLTCSDSRVPPELVFDQNLGDLFVIRAAGNIADAIELGSIEYAVEHLGSALLVVLGHEKCGAVTAACSGEKMPTANLQAIVDKIDPAVAQARTYATPAGLLDAAILENVHQSARDVLANSEVLRHAHEEGKLAVIEAVYKLEAGEVVRLPSSVNSH